MVTQGAVVEATTQTTTSIHSPCQVEVEEEVIRQTIHIKKKAICTIRTNMKTMTIHKEEVTRTTEALAEAIMDLTISRMASSQTRFTRATQEIATAKTHRALMSCIN